MNILSFDSNYKSHQHKIYYVNQKLWKGEVYTCQVFVCNDPAIIELLTKKGLKRWNPETHDYYKEEDYAGKSTLPDNESGQQVSDATEDAGASEEGRGDTSQAPTVPENWQELSWPEKRSIASKLTNDVVSNKAQAEQAIKEYLGEIDGV